MVGYTQALILRVKNQHRRFLPKARNPLVLRDFIMNLRKERYFVLMGLILLAGVLVIGTLWPSEIDDNFPTGRKMFYLMVAVEMLAVLFLLPGLVANSIIYERNGHILEMLLVTPLSGWQILLGRLLAVFGVILLLIFSTFPLISISMARGGVSPTELILGIILILYTSLLASSFAILYALHANTTFQAILLTLISIAFCYFSLALGVTSMVAMIMGFISLLIRVLEQAQWIAPTNQNVFIWIAWLVIGIDMVICLFLPFIILLIARGRLWNMEPRHRETHEMRTQIVWQVSQNRVDPQLYPIKSLWPVEGEFNPFYAREQMGYKASQNPYALPVWYLFAIFTQGFFWLVGFDNGRWLAVFALVVTAQMIPAFTSGLFAGEREARTWDLLRATCASYREILSGKIKAALRIIGLRAATLYLLPFTVGTVLLLSLSAITGANWHGITAAGLLFHIPVLTLQILFLTLLCTYISIRFKQVYPVYGWCYAIICGYLFAPLLLAAVDTGLVFGDTFLWTLRIVSPMLLLIQFNEISPFFWLALIVHLLLYLLACGIMESMARRQLRKDIES